MITSRHNHARVSSAVLFALVSFLLAARGYCAAPTYEFELNNAVLDHMTSGDMNGDNKPDLVMANSSAGGVTILFNTGNAFPNFFNGAATNLTAANATFVAVGDLDGDGRMDIVCGNSSGNATVRVFLQAPVGSPAGTFPATPSSSPAIGSTSTGPTSLVLVDVNGDHKLDIVTANKDTGDISVLINNGDGTFKTGVRYVVGSQPVSVAAGDVNGDGFADIVVACAGESSVFFLLNDGTGKFGFPYGVLVGDSQKQVSLVDLNKDGILDLAVVQSAGTAKNNLAVCLGIGDGTFGAPTNNLTPTKAQSFATADVTGDGNIDVVLATQFGPTGPSIFGLRGNGNGTFLAGSDFQFTVNAVATATVLADFDGDGQLDVATSCVNPAPAGLYIEKLNPRATLSSLSPFQAIVGGTTFTLTVNGSNFKNGAVVNWNGIARTTTFVSATQLTASIPAGDLANAGKIPVTVTNPAPGGFASDAAFFSVYPTTIGSFTVLNTQDSGSGSLRFAMQQARNGDSIVFDPVVFDLTNSDAATVINVLSPLPPLDDGSVTIDSSDRRVTVNGTAAGSANGLLINSSSNKVMGLTLVGFTNSGISIQGGAKNNIIGGPRSSGTGPNGQGLRIANCGAFGIEITDAGTSGNVIKGCWIGLDSSGTTSSPNLAGILIQGGAPTNTIGGTADGESNSVSGNTFEGVTVSGAGTDSNVVIGNIVGAAAIATSSRSVSARDDTTLQGRNAVSNGSAGVFLSKGTQGSTVGGTNPGESNAIANNGGNGVEVRANNSKKNSSKSNKITKNIKGGIALFDGSNEGVTPPTEDDVTAGAATGSTQKVHVRGSAARDGTIELFNDSGSQGETLIGRAGVVGGRFDVEVDSTISQKLTATLTDSNGNTSAFHAITVPPGSGGGTTVDTTDTDGDGASDVLETLAGTDPNNSSDKPLDGGVLVVDKPAISANFSATGKDSLKAVLNLVLPAGFVNANTGVNIQFGGISKNFVLDLKGKSPKGTATVSLKGGSLLASTAPKAGAFTLAMKGDLRAGLVASGFTDKTTAKDGDVVTVPVALGLIVGANKYVFAGQVLMVYKATQGKSGKASLPK